MRRKLAALAAIAVISVVFTSQFDCARSCGMAAEHLTAACKSELAGGGTCHGMPCGHEAPEGHAPRSHCPACRLLAQIAVPAALWAAPERPMTNFVPAAPSLVAALDINPAPAICTPIHPPPVRRGRDICRAASLLRV